MFRKILAGGLSVVLAVSAMSFTPFAQEKQLAFPGAEGGGMYSQGARAAQNFTVYHVTNLNDSGAGSFRDAVSQGNRIIIFDVAGNIMLESSLEIRNSNLTILGQTAPGEGICIGGSDVRFRDGKNIIVRYMRFRMGDISNSQEDGLGIRNCAEVILDHCSVSWSIDECLSAYANKNFTAQYCIISESLNQSHHAKGDHGYGGIWGGINASFHHNLIASHSSRTPRIGTAYTVNSYNDTPDYESLIDIRNNVIYNWGIQCGYGGENNVRVNLVNNYYKPTKTAKTNIIYESYEGVNDAGTTLHVSGNVFEGNDAITNNNWTGVSQHKSYTKWTKCESISDGYTDESGKLWSNDQYIYDYPVNTTDANTAYNDVLDKAGASHYRDEIDTRVINDVINGTVPTGSISGEGLIDSQNDVGGWVSLYGEKPEDKDNDGMADNWERANNLDTSKNDSTAIASNGYTNIENYAESILGTEYEGYNADSSLLKAELDMAKALKETDYSSEQWNKLIKAISEAEEIYNLSAPTQEQLDNAYKNLKSVVDSMVTDHMDYVRSTIEKAKAIDLNLYTYETASLLLDAVAKAEEDLKNNNTSAYETDAKAIEDAITNLKQSNKAKLKKLIDFVKAMDISNLTVAAKSEFNNALNAVENVYNKFEATEDDVSKAINDTYAITHKKYDIVNTGREVYNIDFENGYNNEFSLVYDGSQKPDVVVEKGYASNNTNVVRTDTSLVQAYLPIDTNLRHFRVSCDVTGNSNYWLFLSNYNKDINLYYIEYFMRARSLSDGKQQIDFDWDYDDFTDNSKWTNFAIEINKDTNEAIFFINNLPIYKSSNIVAVEYWGTNLSQYGYADNFVLSDLSGASYYLVGDVDFDGKITTSDVSSLLEKILTGKDTVMEQNIGNNAMKYIDMDCNGTLDSADVAHLLQKILDSTYKTPADKAFETITETSTENTTEESKETVSSTETTTVTENSTEATTSSIIDYPVDGGFICFDRATGTITGYSSAPVNVVIPDSIEGVSVEAIANSAFSSCRSLKSISIPSSVKKIGETCFDYSSLTSVDLSYGLEEIGAYAFNDTLITDITIPGSVQKIGMAAFASNKKLENIIFEEGITELDRNMFRNANPNVRVQIPQSVVSIGSWTGFAGTILCYEGSYAQQYAVDNNFKYEIIQ